MSRGILIAMLFAFALGVPRDTSADAATTSLCAALPRVAENVPSPSSDVVPLVARDDAIRTALRFARSSDVALCSIRLGVHDSFLQEKPLVWVVDVDAATSSHWAAHSMDRYTQRSSAARRSSCQQRRPASSSGGVADRFVGPES